MRKKIHVLIIFSLLIFLPIITVLQASFVQADAGDSWFSLPAPEAPIESPEGVRYSQFIDFDLLKTGPSQDQVPIEINPVFDDEYCNASSLRILFENGTDFVELAYQNSSDYEYYPSGYLQTVNLTFIVPEFDENSEQFRLYWTYNGTDLTDADYSSDFSEIRAPNSTLFYYNDQVQTSEIDIQFDSESYNNSYSLLIKKPLGDYSIELISSQLEYWGNPKFSETSALESLDLSADYDGYPMSIKVVKGDTTGWSGGTDTYLIIGTYNGTLIYKHTSGNTQFNYVDEATFGFQTNCYGLAVGDVINDGTHEILVGFANGDVRVYEFDGVAMSLADTLTLDGETRNRKTWGIGVFDGDTNGWDSNYQIVTASAHSDAAPNRGYISYYNESREVAGDLLERDSTDFTIGSPASYYASDILDEDTYGPNVYVGDFIPDSQHSGNEILFVQRNDGGNLMMSIADIHFNDVNRTDVYKTWLDDSSYGLGLWKWNQLTNLQGSNQLTAAAFSKKLNNNNNMSIITGSSTGTLLWYNVTYESSDSVDLLGGTDYDDYSIDLGSSGESLLPIVGNFDDEYTNYDDVVVASSEGKLYYLKVNPSSGNLEYVGEQILAAGTNLVGIGQSIASMDILTGDNEEELFIAGDDGVIRVLTAEFPNNIRIDVGAYNHGSPDSQYAGENIFNETTCNNFNTKLSDYYTANPDQTVELNGDIYYKIPLNVSSDSIGMVHLEDLAIEYNTTDYSITETPPEIYFSQPFNTFNHQNIDNDQDGYPDIYEHLNLVYVKGGGNIKLYLSGDGVPTTFNHGDALPAAWEGMDPWDADTDGDLIPDGYEMNGTAYSALGSYTGNYTNPTDADTDGDGLTDYQELVEKSSLFGSYCVVHTDYDNDGLNDFIEWNNEGDPQNGDTDADGLSDFEEYDKYGSNLNNTDTDGDGIPDRIESGKNQNERLYNWIFGEQRYYSWKEDGSGLNLSDADSDGDGIDDLDEIDGVSSVQWQDQETATTYQTDPTIADTDGDGINDHDEAVGRSVTYIEAEKVGGVWQFEEITDIDMVTNPQSQDTDSDGVPDLIESTHKTNPIDEDTDNDGLTDGQEIDGIEYEEQIIKPNATHPDTDEDGLTDGVEVAGTNYNVGAYSNPLLNDTDGDGWLDGYEVLVSFTNPLKADSDGDGIIDSEDPMPMLSNLMTILTYILVGFSVVASILSYPINKRAAKVATRAKVEYKKKLQKITDRIERERRDAERVIAFARMMPSNIETGKLNVKINLRVIDKSFYCREAKLWYSATGEFESVRMDKIDDRNFSIVLANIPIDMTVLYYFELLDRGGVWLKQLRNEEEQKTYEFSTGKDGVTEATDWDTSDLVKCSVCGYMCRPEWDKCPECNTPIHDDMMYQEVFLDDQVEKEEKRAKETDPDEIAWKEAQETDEFWRGLPECPSCAYTVQEDWAKCPVCGFDLTSVELKKKAVYDDVEADWDAMMGEDHEQLYDDTEKLKSAKDTKKEMEEAKKKKKAEKKKDDVWGSSADDRDVL
ncbi:MAG: hypothetical protein GF364_02215 [Candidatus Lokiarchaeota archaeon]|nr:hypothetical protein [Candidatus Lokiarchaeota archaeon]